VDSSNTFFIDYIPPRGTVDQHLRLFAIPDAAARNHTITVSFVYEDMEANPFDSTANIGVNVRQLSRLDLGQVSVQEFVQLGVPVHVNFNFSNTGRSTLRNLRIRFEGEGIDGSNADDNFGNMQGGEFNFFFGSFAPVEPGPTTVRLVATFDDDMDEPHEIVKEFPIEVMGGFGGGGDFGERPGMDGGFDMFPGFEEEGEGNWWTGDTLWTSLWFWGVCVLGVLVITGGIVVIVAVKKGGRSDEDRYLGNFGDDDDF
jgi:hypothetical protein